MKKLTVYDATKEELIQYFFNPIDGGFRVTAPVDRFLIWLKQKRTKDLLDAQDVSAEQSQKYLQEYVELVKEANETEDLEEKLKIFEKANKAYENYEKSEKLYDKLDIKVRGYLDL